MHAAAREAVVAVLGAEAASLMAAAPGPVMVACSGGADSLALLALAAAVRSEPERDVFAVHVDHGARAGSEAEAAIVGAAARAFGTAFRTERVDVAPGPSFEARARDARYQALDRVAAEVGAASIAVGHTRDDQAETVLLNLLRGAATTGLSGMPANRGRIVRPLLGVGRSATAQVCARLHLDVVDDPMNGDVGHRRVWLRREVIPALEAGADRDLRGVLARQAEILRSESELLDQLASDLLAAAGDPPAVRVLAAAGLALRRRAVRAWLHAELRSPPSLADVDGVLAVLAGNRSGVNLAGGAAVLSRRGHLVRRPARSGHDHDTHRMPALPRDGVPVDLPGVTCAGGWRLDAWVERAAPLAWPEGRWTCVLDADTAGLEEGEAQTAVLRPARPGERFRPLGLDGHKTIDELRREIAPSRTGPREFPVLAAGQGDALWVVGYRIADRVRVTPRTRRYLWIAAAADPAAPAKAVAR